jgi:hypothetical protein
MCTVLLFQSYVAMSCSTPPPPSTTRSSPDEGAAQGAEGCFAGGDLEEESLPGLPRLTAEAEEANSGRNRAIAGERPGGRREKQWVREEDPTLWASERKCFFLPEVRGRIRERDTGY